MPIRGIENFMDADDYQFSMWIVTGDISNITVKPTLFDAAHLREK